MIVLLGPHGHQRQGAAEVGGCVGATSSSQEEGVRATAPEKRDSLLSNVHGWLLRKHLGRGRRSNTRSSKGQHLAVGQFSSCAYTGRGRWEKGERPCWRKDVGKKSIKHRIQLVCQVVEHAADVIQDRHRCFFAENKEISHY